MFTWLKNGLFRPDFKRDRAESLLRKIDLKDALTAGVYALLVEKCSKDDIDFLMIYFHCEQCWDSLVTSGLITKIIRYKEKSEKNT